MPEAIFEINKVRIFSFYRHGKSGLLSLHFLHKCTGVDLDKRAVAFSDVQEHEDAPSANGGLRSPGDDTPGRQFQSEAKYDLLVGADGVRSIVRAAFMQHLRRWVKAVAFVFEWSRYESVTNTRFDWL